MAKSLAHWIEAYDLGQQLRPLSLFVGKEKKSVDSLSDKIVCIPPIICLVLRHTFHSSAKGAVVCLILYIETSIGWNLISKSWVDILSRHKSNVKMSQLVLSMMTNLSYAHYRKGAEPPLDILSVYHSRSIPMLYCTGEYKGMSN